MACDGKILISLIEKRPSIYDYKDKDHSNRAVQNKLWENIVCLDLSWLTDMRI